jgi:glycerophosphoryl diester phosphodiesterase
MTKIVGHRGASGQELENTIKSFKLAKELGVDAIELDILATSAGKIVVCHDDDLKRLSGKKVRISDLTYAELAEIHLHNGETIPLLYDVLSIVEKIPVILDLKTEQYLPNLFAVLNDFPGMQFTIVTELRHIIRECKQLRPDIPAFAQRHYSPFGLMKTIEKYGADGLNLNFYWLNPVTYRAIKKKGLQVQVYTVNNVLVAQLLKKLYPGIWICTNHPDKFLYALKQQEKKK